MLHEVIVVLSGQRSSLVTREGNKGLEPYVHKSEQALLRRVCVLGEMNREIQHAIEEVNEHLTRYTTTTHACMKCLEERLTRPFGLDLVGLEKRVLCRDPAVVAGDNMVSLSMVVGEVSVKWERLFKYGISLVGFLRSKKRTTSELHERLAKDNITGYADVKDLTVELMVAVERSWVYQLNNWLGYGKISKLNKEDFFITVSDRDEFRVVQELVPTRIMSKKAVDDAFLIGKSVSLMTNGGKQLQKHQLYVNVQYPVEASSLERAICSMKDVIYGKIIKESLPIEKLRLFFQVLRTFPLLESVDFMDGFENDELGRSDDALAHSLACYLEDSTDIDKTDKYTLAKSIFSLTRASGGDEFSDFVLNIHTQLNVELDWPYNILLNPVDANTYSFLFHYLFALSKTRRNLIHAWKHTKQLDHHTHADLMHTLFRLKLFLDELWSYSQNSIVSLNFESKIMTYLNPSKNLIIDDLLKQQTDFLESTCQGLFVDNPEFRKTCRHLLVSSTVLAETIISRRPHMLAKKDSTISDAVQTMKTLHTLMENSDQIYSDKLNTLLLQLEAIVT
jgi:hypothetical protein